MTSFRRTWPSASNAHAYRLYVFNDHPTHPTSTLVTVFCASFAAISEALYYDTTFRANRKNFQNFFSPTPSPPHPARNSEAPRHHASNSSSLAVPGEALDYDTKYKNRSKPKAFCLHVLLRFASQESIQRSLQL